VDDGIFNMADVNNFLLGNQTLLISADKYFETVFEWQSLTRRAPSAVGHETLVVGQVERRLPGQRLVKQTRQFELERSRMGSQWSSRNTGEI